MMRNGKVLVDDPDVTDEHEFQRGYNHAAEMDEPYRSQVYRRMYRTSYDPFAVGFRAFVIGSASPVGGSRA